MKKIIGIICTVLMMSINSFAWAGEKEPAKRILGSSSQVITKTERITLEKRVMEIRDMKLNTLNSAEKQELKTELLAIKDKLSGQEPFTGIYLSAGAIIIILLILLIIT